MGEPGTFFDEDLRAAPECRLTTIGRTSGQPRQIEIWFAAVGDRIYLLSGGRDRSHWVRNLQANPEIQIRVRRRTFEGRASVVEGTADDSIAREALGAKYGPEGLADWLRDSLPVKITIEREIAESGG